MNILFLSFFALFSGLFGEPRRTDYNLGKPDRVLVLPDTLHEISGISVAGSLIACVQDEHGIIFLYNPVTARIERQISFGPDGDYEDIVWLNGTYYVLRSDGLLYQVIETPAGVSVTTYFTGIPAKDSEGLCYDGDRNALLIAVKSKSGKGKKQKSRRDVYLFDLAEKKLQPQPFMVIDGEDVRQFAGSNGIDLPVKYKKKGKKSVTILKLTSSAIAIHPKNGEIFILSSADRLLMVFDKQFRLKDLIALDPYRFNKAEGIDFSESGQLYISNEGQHKEPTILVFELQ